MKYYQQTDPLGCGRDPFARWSTSSFEGVPQLSLGQCFETKPPRVLTAHLEVALPLPKLFYVLTA